MKKWGEILLFILNFCINVFLIAIVVMLLLWLILGITPEKSVQGTALWIEQNWNYLIGRTSKERTEDLSQKQKEKAHRYIYLQEPSKHDEGERISQPYRYE